MAAYQVLLLNTAVPQIQAAQSGDTYVVPRDIAFSAALTLSAGTANGVPYLDGSKVLTSGSALTFDGTGFSVGGAQDGGRLTLIGGAGFAGTGLSVYESSTGNNARLRLQQDAGVVVYNATFSSGGNAHAWQIGNSEQMRLTSTGLGIGTNNPGVKLDVSYSDDSYNAGIRVTNTFNGSGAQAKIYAVNNAGEYVSLGRNSATLGSQSAIFSTGAYPLEFYTNSTLRATLDSSGNLGLGGSAARATTAGTAALNIFDGTAPVGTLANGISIYSSSGEAYVMDAAGNATLFSPHDSETNEWIFRSKHTPTGKVLRIDVERLLRFVNDHFGLDAVKEFVEE